VGSGASPSEALRDAAQQGFQGSDVVLGALGGGLVTMGGMDPMDEADAEEEMMESRLKRDLGKDVLSRGRSVNMQKLKTLARMMTKKHAGNLEDLEYEIAELGDIYQGEPAESPEYAELNRAEAIALRDMLVDALRKSPPPTPAPQQTFDPNDTWIPDPEYGEINESARSVVGRWNKLAGLMTEGRKGRLNEFKWPWEDYESTPMTDRLEAATAAMLRDMRAAGMGKPGFNPEALMAELHGDDSSSTGVGIWVWFESGSFPVVGGLVPTEADLLAAVQRRLPSGVSAVNAERDLHDRDPDTNVGTYGWKIRLGMV